MSELNFTKQHELYYQALRDKKMYPTLAYGSAGTAKTYGAVEAAYEALVNKRVERIICTRPNIPFAKESGYLPGTEREKLLPWIRPILQHFSNFAHASLIEDWEKRGKLVFYPLESIQGLTFDNSFVILDECQNLTFKQLMVFMQRTGEYSKIVMCGDIAQVSPMFKGSGLAEFLDMVEHFDLPVHRIHFTRDDIVRSGICKQFVVAEEEWELYVNS